MCIDIWAPQSRGFKRFILYKHSPDQDENVFPHSRIPRIRVHSYWGSNVLIQYLGLVASFRLCKNIIGRCWLLQRQYLLGKILQSKLVTFSCALYIVLRNSQVFVIWVPSIMCEESYVVVFTIGTRLGCYNVCFFCTVSIGKHRTHFVVRPRLHQASASTRWWC